MEGSSEKTRTSSSPVRQDQINQIIVKSLSNHSADEALRALLAGIGGLLHAERCYIFELDEGEKSASNTYEWCAEGIQPEIGNLRHMPMSVYGNIWMQYLLKNRSVLIPDVEAWKEKDPAVYKTLHAQHIHRLAVSPFFRFQRFAGFIGVDNPPEGSLNDTADFFMTLTSFISVLLGQRDSQKQLADDAWSAEVLASSLAKALAVSDPARSVETLLAGVGSRIQADRTYIFEADPKGRFNNTFEWCREGVSSEKDHLQNLSMQEWVPSWEPVLKAGKSIFIEDLESYKTVDPAAYDILKPQKIHSVIECPLFVEKRFIGFMGIDNPDHDTVANTTVLYEMMAGFVAGMLRHRDNEHRLRVDHENDASLNDAIIQSLALIDPVASIRHLLAYTGSLVHAERTFIFEMQGQDQVTNTYEWCADGVKSLRSSEQNIRLGRYSQELVSSFKGGKDLIIRDIEQYRSISKGLYEALASRMVTSIILVPLFLENRFIGFLGADNPPAETADNTGTLFHMAASFVSVMIRHRDNSHKLQENAWRANILNDAAIRALSEEDADASIETLLETIGSSLDCDRIYICEKKVSGKTVSTYEWCRKDMRPIDHAMDGYFDACMQEWESSLKKHEQIIISSRQDPKYADENVRLLMRALSVDRCIFAPIIIENRYLGVIGTDNPVKSRMESTSMMLDLASAFAGTLLRHRDSLARIHHDSFADQLTGTWNRHGLERFVSQIDRKTSIGLVYSDLNGLKEINDTKGHAAGDALIRSAADVMRRSLPDNHQGEVFRMGGDEFLIVLSGMSEADFMNYIGHLKQMSKDEGVSMSTGYLWKEKVPDNFDGLITRVDLIMYHSKQDFHAEMRRNTLKNYRVNLKECLRNGEFVPYIQPKVEIATGKIVGGEVLVRWQHNGEIIGPDSFIPDMEESGFISDLDDHMWEKTYQIQKSFRDAGIEPLPLSVNLSRVDFRVRDVARRFESLSDQYGIEPFLVRPEITESVYVRDTERITQCIDELHEKGFIILMDDFGSGYSSLKALNTFKVDVLKLDQSFLQDPQKAKDSMSIIESVVNMAHMIGKLVIMEGIENAGQAKALDEMNCRYGQGNYFYAAMRQDAFLELIRDPSRIERHLPGMQRHRVGRLSVRNILDEHLISEDKLNQILGPIIIFEVSEDHVDLLQMNDPYCQLTGITGDDLQARVHNNTSAMAVIGRDDHVLYYYNRALTELLPPRMSYDSGRTFNEFFFGSEENGISGLFEQADRGLRTVAVPGGEKKLQISVLSTFWSDKPAYLIYFYLIHEGDRKEIEQKEAQRARVSFNNFLYSGTVANARIEDADYKSFFIWNLSEGGTQYRRQGYSTLSDEENRNLDFPHYREFILKLSAPGSEAEAFMKKATIEYYLNAFHEGSYEHEVTLTYRTKKGPVTMHSDISMMESPDTGDIYLKVQNSNVTNQTYIDKLIRSAMQDFFDELIYIDGSVDVSYVVDFLSKDGPLHQRKGSIAEMLPFIANHIGQSLSTKEQLFHLIRNTCGEKRSGLLTYQMSDQKVKSIKMHILDAEHEIYYISIEDVSEILNMENYQYHDRLTGLPNMTWFQIQAQVEMQNMQRKSIRPVFLYFDLVALHRFNDAYGYEQGDGLIRETAEVLHSVFKEQPVARFYEDHFCVLTTPDDLEEKLVKVRDRIAAYRKRLDGSQTGASVLRAGVYYAEDPEESITSCCDHARLAANRLHGQLHDFYRIYTDQISEDEKKKAYILDHFQEAMEKGWIDTYYQPIVSTGVGQADGAPEKEPVDYEALSRWNDPVYGQISPGFFVPVLEEYRLVDQLDLYMIRNVGRDYASLRERCPEHLPPAVSVNLSRVDFDHDEIVERVIRTVDEAGLPRKHLHIEVTESAMADDEANLHALAKKLKDAGFDIWLDDFGTGYSSLKVLIDFDFDVLKLDMSLLRKIMVNERSRLLVRHVLQMAKSLNIETLCEGVETEEQYWLLKEMGCGRIQGYLFGRPEPFDPDKKY